MSSVLPPQAYIHSLRCPCDGMLAVDGDKARCQSCHRELKISPEGILQLVIASELDAPTAQELVGHTYDLSQPQIEKKVLAERNSLWKNYYSRNRMKTMQHLSRYLDRVNCEQVFFLGVGTGREVEYLLSFRKLDTVFCSDLSYTSLRMIPTRLAVHDLKVGLFTSDLQRCPIADRSIPIVIVNALHHTRDMHAVIESLLAQQYDNLFLVEPTDNFLIRLLARYGIAQRQEYSGVIPGRLELPRLKEMCRKHHYQVDLRTHWAFPRDYYRKIFGSSMRFQKVFFPLLNGISALTDIVKFGNFSIVHLHKPDAGHAAGSNRPD